MAEVTFRDFQILWRRRSRLDDVSMTIPDGGFRCAAWADGCGQDDNAAHGFRAGQARRGRVTIGGRDVLV